MAQIQDTIVDNNLVLSELKNFLQFLCEGKSCTVESVINSSISLLNDCPSSRDAVLQFYSQLFDEYCGEYCVTNCNVDNNAISASVSGEKVGPIISRFVLTNKTQKETVNESNIRKMSTDSRRHSMCSDDGKNGSDAKTQSMSNTPQSPTNISSPNEPSSEHMDGDNEVNSNWSAIISSLDYHFNRISETLMAIINCESNNFAKDISDWSLKLAAKLSAKYSRFSTSFTTSSTNTASHEVNSSLSCSLAFWLQCPPMQTLINLIISNNNIEIEVLLKQLLLHSPHTDWILAHLITTMSSNSGFTTYIEHLMQSAATSASVTCILSYLSEHNPRAIVNCSKSNIPFLLKLCTNSKPLLDLLAQEAVKNLNFKELNELSYSTKADELNDQIIYCMTNAPNAFEFLILAFEICVHNESSDQLQTKTLNILTSIIAHIHEFVYGSNVTVTNSPPILILLKNNINSLILHFVKTLGSSCRRIQLRLLHLLCIHYGNEFVTEVVHYILNARLHNIDSKSFRNPSLNPLLFPLLRSLKLQYGSQIQHCLSDTLKLPFEKSVCFWAHLLAAVENESFYLDIDLLTKYFSNFSQESNTDLFERYYLLRLMMHTMEKFPKRIAKPQHRLCLSFVSTYFDLIRLQQTCDTTELDIHMDSLVTCQKSMSLLAKNYSINEYIITRILLEQLLEKNDLFNTRLLPKENVIKDNAAISLLKENVLYDSGNSKFRKIPLVSNKKPLFTKNKIARNESVIINQQLILDAFRCCVCDMSSFAKLLVQCVSPDLIFNDMPWPDEDQREGQLQHLRVTIERDLFIARLFDSNPLLWDLCDLVCNAGHLRNCLVLIRALITVQRTHWSSTSLSKEDIFDTQRLLTLLSKSEILPSVPFKYVPLVLTELQPWEVSCVLNDICKYLKDSICSTTAPPLKPYIERLRLLMAHNMPGPLFVKIFKGL